MLRALALFRSSSTAVRAMQSKVLQRPSALASFASLRQVSPVAGLAPHASARRQAWDRRSLHNPAAAAAAAAADEAATKEDQALVYEMSELDVGYINFIAITGTVQSVHPVEHKDQHWVKVMLSVPTPGTTGFTLWTCLCNSNLAAEAAKGVHEGMTVQASGTLLQLATLENLKWKQLLSLPALFAESFGIISPQLAETLQQYVVMPVMDQQVMKLFLESGGQQLHPPPPEPPAEFKPRGLEAAAPIIVDGMPEHPANEMEEGWLSLFKENHLWQDQRKTKTGRQPDFRKLVKQEGQKDALWIQDRRTPDWAKRNLDKLPGGIGLTLPDFIPPEALQGPGKEPVWVELFTNYSAFWDNRENKLSPRGPDFSPKDRTNGALQALWMNEAPHWAVENMDQLPPPPPKRT